MHGERETGALVGRTLCHYRIAEKIGAGGIQPIWAHDGRELFFQGEEQVMSVPVSLAPDLKAGKEQALFDLGPYADSYFVMDVAADGQRFLVARPPAPTDRPGEIQVVVNWLEELKRKVPVDGD